MIGTAVGKMIKMTKNTFQVIDGKSLKLNDKIVSISTKDPSVTEDIVMKAFKAQKVSSWFQNFDTTKAALAHVEVRDVFFFRGDTLGFLIMNCEVYDLKDFEEKTKNPDAKVPRLPGYVFIRGDAVSVLFILIEEKTKTKYVILTEQFRTPAGRPMIECPAGMMDEERNFTGVAAKEIEEEVGIKVKGEDLQELITIAPSPGGCDENVKIFYYEKEVSEEKMRELEKHLGGLRDHGELIALKILKLDPKSMLENLEVFDAKLASALFAYFTKFSAKL